MPTINSTSLKTNVKISKDFKQKTFSAILAILFFIIVYLALVFLAFIVLSFCFSWGIRIMFSGGLYPLLAGIGLICTGVLVAVFMIKFIFNKTKTDRSDLIEITSETHPELFLLIKKIVDKADTNFPKKVYISDDVNAAVFYDSGFWSMFLPIKKNLQIGLGLVNAVTVTEFEAILAHEFGHFSQKTMKVGSYVYNVNKIIYNMLYENEGFNKLPQNLSKINGLVTVFVLLALRIIEGIQWILKKVYNVVNVNYMALSRAMEFHADAVAVSIAGSKALTTSLLRLDFANQCYNSVIEYYNGKINSSVKTLNIYPQQKLLMQFYADEDNMMIEDGFPQLTLEDVNKYNRSKLVIKNQWASHPETSDRVAHIQEMNIQNSNSDQRPATVLFNNITVLEEQVTGNLFSNVTYSEEPVLLNTNQFQEDFMKEYRNNSFDKRYNGYYNNKNLEDIDIAALLNDKMAVVPSDIKTLFSDQMTEQVYTSIALVNDLNILGQIKDGSLKVSTFDYDGNKYHAIESEDLIYQLEENLKQIKNRILQNDQAIFQHFYHVALKSGRAKELVLYYERFLHFDKEYEYNMQYCIDMHNALAFIQQALPIEEIELKLKELSDVEEKFKIRIKEVLDNAIYKEAVNDDIKNLFTQYLSENWRYFNQTVYNDEALNNLFGCIRSYQEAVARTYFNLKKNLLDYQIGLDSVLQEAVMEA